MSSKVKCNKFSGKLELNGSLLKQCKYDEIHNYRNLKRKMSPEKNLKDKHTLYITLQCILNYLHIKILKKNENKNITTKRTALAGIHHTAILMETKQGQKRLFHCSHIQPQVKRKIQLGLGWIFVMLNKMNLWMGRIGSVLLDFILMTLSQNWGTGVELVAKTRKDSNSLLITLKMQFLDLFVNLF